MSFNLLTVEIRAEQHVVLARQRARKIGALLGLDLREQTQLATAVSELARNALQYGGGGRAIFSVRSGPPLFQVVIQDQGPGIADLPAVLEGRYVSQTGMGLGITGSRRLVDRFEIDSTPQTGTTVTLGKQLRGDLSVTPQLVNAIAAELARTAPDDLAVEVQRQNQELLTTLADLRSRQREVEELNAALEGTNRELTETNLGIIALHAELDDKAQTLERQGEALRVFNHQLEEANAELVAQRKELERADRAKTEFLAVLAHELRNPLGALSNALYLTEQGGASSASLAKHHGVARRQALQLTRLVEDLLDVSRITQGRIELRRKPVELASILADAVESSRAAMEARKQTLDTAVPVGRIRLHADQARLTQVFANLLNNAIKFTPVGGRLGLEARLAPGRPDRVEVSVKDSGVGISAEMLGRVFDMFTQAPQTLERSQGGLGIGLTLVRSLVEMHGGSVVVRSDGLDQGAQFTVTLPILPKTLAPEPLKDVGDSPDQRSLRLLVVDDHPDAADTLGEILESWGHSVRIARDGMEAVAAARAYQPDWLLCDIGLPGLDGHEVAAALRAQPETAQIHMVAVTGYGTKEDVQAAEEAGFEAHLTKPIDPEKLKALLASD